MPAIQHLKSNIRNTFKRKRYVRITVAAVAVAAAIAGPVFAVQIAQHRNQQANARAEAAKAERLHKERLNQLAEQQAKNQVSNNAAQGQTAQSPTPTPQTQNNTTTSPAAKPIKYSVSSDPRSTAYSYTPPAPHTDSFTTKITRNGQVPAGTMVYYNATKGDKGYYGGDLAVTGSVTYSKSGAFAPTKNVTISSPDGAVIHMPSSPWNDGSPYFIVAAQGSMPPTGSTYNLVVDMFGNPPIGTHTLHIFSNRTENTGSITWEYHAFITITVVE